MHKRNSDEIRHLIFNSAREANILPITSRCDSHCIFCSHKNNPPGFNVVSIGVRSLEEIGRTIALLNPRHVITIGESATAIIEGEPLCHLEFKEIIGMVRHRFPATQISLTTIGHGLDEETVSFLKKNEPMEISLSLNSATIEGRSALMKDRPHVAEQTLAGVKLLHKYQMEFHGRIVAMPHLVGWEDIDETIRYLADNGATTVRIFLPAYSKKAGPNLRFDISIMQKELRSFVEDMAGKVPCPVLLEPSCVSDLTPVLSGVIRGSKAWVAGLRKGDIVRDVNGQTPRSRVEAWNFLQMPGRISVKAERDGRPLKSEWDNGEGGRSGAIVEYDFDMVRAEDMRQTILSCPGRSLLLTSEFGHTVVRKVLELIEIGDEKAETVMVKNHTFGGTIMAAGLLTVDDYYKGYELWRKSHQEPSQIIVPLESFNSMGFDLRHRHYSDLQKMTGVSLLLK